MIALEQLVVSIRTSRALCTAVNACRCPDGRHGDEDGDESEDQGAKFGRVDSVLEDREESFGQVSTIDPSVRKGDYLPGIIKLWQPMMKMICMGPNCRNPSLCRCHKASPNFPTKTAQKKKILMVVVMFVALASHS